MRDIHQYTKAVVSVLVVLMAAWVQQAAANITPGMPGALTERSDRSFHMVNGLIADSKDTKAVKDDKKSGSEQPAVKRPGKIPPRPTVPERAALHRIRQGMEHIKSILHNVRRISLGLRKINKEYMKIQANKTQLLLTPQPTKSARPKAGERSSKGAAGDIRARSAVSQQFRTLTQSVQRIGRDLVPQARGLQQEFYEIEREVGQLGPSPKVLWQELQHLAHDARNARKSIIDLKSELDKEYGQVPCSDRITKGCETQECKSCCELKNKLTTAPGTDARAWQEAFRDLCIDQCEARAGVCLAGIQFGIAEQKANQLLELLSGILKDMHKQQSGTTKKRVQ